MYEPREQALSGAGLAGDQHASTGTRHLSRDPHDLTTYSDIDMKSSNADGRFVHKDGTPYPEP